MENSAQSPRQHRTRDFHAKSIVFRQARVTQEGMEVLRLRHIRLSFTLDAAGNFFGLLFDDGAVLFHFLCSSYDWQNLRGIENTGLAILRL
jgi:hypothetical protein